MRIIHTSDWHLGQNFMGKTRVPEHQAFLAWLLTQIDAHQVDVVIVAGDIFDTGSPPSYAREMYNRFIVDIQSKQCALVILSGNHDSVATLNESKALLARLNTQVVSSVSEKIEEQVLTLKDRNGDAAAILCAIPFIRQRDVVVSKAGQSGREKQHTMQQAITEHYQRLYNHAESIRQHNKKPIPIIATGHLTTVGARTTESVREIYIGTLDAFPASGFPPADYIALGHIHKSQRVAKSDHIRYSGSPLPLSFDETANNKRKSVLLVDFKKGKLATVTPLAVPCFQAMAVIRGDLESIEQQIIALSDNSEMKEGQTIWLEVIVSSQDYLTDLQQRLQQMTVDLPIEVLLLRRERNKKNLESAFTEKETLNELDVFDVFERRLAEEAYETETQQQQAKRLRLMFKKLVNELEDSP